MPFVNWYFYPKPDDTDVLSEMFWNQIEWTQPESYISDGSECVTFVSRNQHLFDTVLGCLKQRDRHLE